MLICLVDFFWDIYPSHRGFSNARACASPIDASGGAASVELKPIFVAVVYEQQKVSSHTFRREH